MNVAKRIAAAAAALLISVPAFATGLPVIDAANLIQSTMTAMQALKTEVYENTSIVYQYKQMANELLQSTGLDVDALMAQAAEIKDDIKAAESYGSTLKDLYGTLSDSAEYLTQVQSMVTQSGKSPAQWFYDARTLLANGDKTAKRMFDMGNQINDKSQKLAKRRKTIQEQMDMSPTAAKTAQSTTQMLDVLASQNSDMLQLMSAKTQADAAKDQKDNAEQTERTQAAEDLASAKESQLQQLRATVFNNK
jgi:hypothetical protein